MELDRLLESLERLREVARADAVFGEVKTIGEKAIIPVAKVSCGFGMGFGRGKPEPAEGKPEEGEGGGGGGGASSVPLAILEVTPEETRLIPVVDKAKLCIFCMLTMAWNVFFITKALIRLSGRK